MTNKRRRNVKEGIEIGKVREKIKQNSDKETKKKKEN